VCERVADAALRVARPPAMTGLTYLETSPHVTFLLENILRNFRDSRFIHVVRHPASVVRSGLRRGWYNGHSHDKWRIKPAQGTEAAALWGGYSPLQKNVWLWIETNKWILDRTSSMDRERVFLLRSEDLFAGNEEVIRCFYKTIEVPVPARKKIERVLGKQLNAQRHGEFPEFDSWGDADKQFLLNHAGITMAACGYAH